VSEQISGKNNQIQERKHENGENIQCDSELLLGFPWPIIFKPETTKLLAEYESVFFFLLFLVG
jgi:hypothetical protein